MTCPQALSLLDDYIDNELNPTQAADIEQHLAQCDSCRQEYQAGLQLKRVLKQSQDESRLPNPGEDYWSEVSSLILAKTVDSDQPQQVTERPVHIRASHENRQALVRSLTLFAASLVLMLGAIYVGTQKEHFARLFPGSHATMYVSASLSDVVASDGAAIVTKEEETEIIHGMLALGAPGPAGRYGGLIELLGIR